jgi:hypothetical protein
MACAVLIGAPLPVMLHAETTNVQLLDLVRALKLAPNTQAIAAREGFALRDLQVGPAEANAQVGDQVTALVSLFSLDPKFHPSQWIVRLKRIETPRADSQLVRATDLIMYTNVGETFKFHSDLSVMNLETLGPIPYDAKAELPIKARSRAIFVNTDFLDLDLTRTARALTMLHDSLGNGSVFSRTDPFPAAKVEAGRKFLATTKMTSDDIRAFVGGGPALSQFLDIVRSTPSLQGILMQVLDKPSIFDVFRSAARENLTFNFLGGGTSVGRDIFWNDGKTGDFYLLLFNVEIFQKPVLSVALYVAPPTPPLEVSAGVVGIAAFSPRNPSKVVVVRALSSAPGGDAAKSASSPH